MKLKGTYALFLKGQPEDEPQMVGNNPVWLSKAGDAIWGFGNCLVELWQSKLDQEYALRTLADSRTASEQMQQPVNSKSVGAFDPPTQ